MERARNGSRKREDRVDRLQRSREGIAGLDPAFVDGPHHLARGDLLGGVVARADDQPAVRSLGQDRRKSREPPARDGGGRVVGRHLPLDLGKGWPAEQEGPEGNENADQHYPRSELALPHLGHFPHRSTSGSSRLAISSKSARVAGWSGGIGWRARSERITPPSFIRTLQARSPHWRFS